LSLPSGMRFGLCEILAPLGAGERGEVYRAKDPKLSREAFLGPLAPAARTSGWQVPTLPR